MTTATGLRGQSAVLVRLLTAVHGQGVELDIDTVRVWAEIVAYPPADRGTDED
jgi:hypothetical protein